MKFLYPHFLWLLIPLALFAWLNYREYSSKKIPLHPKIILEMGRTPWRRLLLFMALGWMVFALARPVTLQSRSIEAPALGSIYLAIDASRSMMATDRQPNRYSFAKSAIESLVANDKGHKFALIAFTTNAFILTPPTEDREILHAALESFRPDYVLTHGTSIETLLRYLAKLGGDEKNLVIFSDGGDGEDLDTLVTVAKKNRIRIYGVACGTRHGSKIPDVEGWLRDKNGRLVISMQNPLLERLTLASGGVFIDESSPEGVADALISSLERDSGIQKGVQRVRYSDWFWLPLGVAILFLLVGTIAIPKWRRFIALFPFLGLLHADAGPLDLYRLQKGYDLYNHQKYEAAVKVFDSIDPPLLESRYAQASALYRMGAFKRAGRLFSSCRSARPEVQQRIWYNLGNCAVKLGRYKSARDYYVKALQIGPDPDAKANLVKVLFAIEKERRKVEAKANRRVEAASVSGTSQERQKGAAKKEKAQGAMPQGGSGMRSASAQTRISPKRRAAKGVKRHPIGSKVYEMINKGYVNEKKPW